MSGIRAGVNRDISALLHIVLWLGLFEAKTSRMVSLTQLGPQWGWFKCLGGLAGTAGHFFTEISVLIPCVSSSSSSMTCTHLHGSWFFSEPIWMVKGLFWLELINLKTSLLPYSTDQIKSGSPASRDGKIDSISLREEEVCLQGWEEQLMAIFADTLSHYVSGPWVQELELGIHWS